MIRAVWALVAAAALAQAQPALAHKASDAYLNLESRASEVHVRWDISLRDLDTMLVLDADGDERLTWREIRDRQEDIVREALEALTLAVGQGRCAPGPVALSIARRGDEAYAALRFTASCPGTTSRVEAGYRLMQQLDSTHRAIVSVGGAEADRLVVLRPSAQPQGIVLDASTADAAASDASSAFGDFFAEGVRHILDGIDHLAFVLALLVPTVALAGAQRRRLRPTLADLVSVVTLFTLAHSITLVLTALQWISLPSRFVESVIAASVVFAGFHAWLAAAGRLRRDASTVPPWLVFAFGLIHGFGFGGALLESGFGGKSAVAALLGFNLGVEAGQLLVVAVAFPLAWVLRDARLYRDVVSPALAAAIVVAGSGWLIERAFDVELRSILAQSTASPPAIAPLPETLRASLAR